MKSAIPESKNQKEPFAPEERFGNHSQVGRIDTIKLNACKWGLIAFGMWFMRSVVLGIINGPGDSPLFAWLCITLVNGVILLFGMLFLLFHRIPVYSDLWWGEDGIAIYDGKNKKEYLYKEDTRSSQKSGLIVRLHIRGQLRYIVLHGKDEKEAKQLKEAITRSV